MTDYYVAERLVWVHAGTFFSPWKLVDPRPLKASDESGHRWTFDGGASDLDAPYTCVLCSEPQWRAYGQPCGADIDGVNAERDAWIAENEYDGDGAPPGATGPDLLRWRQAAPAPRRSAVGA